jgi:hypothetical protein
LIFFVITNSINRNIPSEQFGVLLNNLQKKRKAEKEMEEAQSKRIKTEGSPPQSPPPLTEMKLESISVNNAFMVNHHLFISNMNKSSKLCHFQ